MTGWEDGLFAIAFGLVQIVMYLIVFGEGGALFDALFFNVLLANPPEHSARAEAWSRSDFNRKWTPAEC